MAGEEDEAKAEEDEDKLEDSHALLKYDLICQKAQACREGEDFVLGLFPLGGEFEDCGLPYLIVLMAKVTKLCENGGIEGLEKGVCFGQLAFLDFGEGISKDTGLLFNILE